MRPARTHPKNAQIIFQARGVGKQQPVSRCEPSVVQQLTGDRLCTMKEGGRRCSFRLNRRPHRGTNTAACPGVRLRVSAVGPKSTACPISGPPKDCRAGFTSELWYGINDLEQTAARNIWTGRLFLRSQRAFMQRAGHSATGDESDSRRRKTRSYTKKLRALGLRHLFPASSGVLW